MDLKGRLNNLLSRKFLLPIIAVLLVWLKDSFFPTIPMDDFIRLVTILGGLSIGTEGIKDIVNNINIIGGKKK